MDSLMKFSLIILTLLLSTQPVFADNILMIQEREGEEQMAEPVLEEKISPYLHSKMQRFGIPGMAIAVVSNGKVNYENYLGSADLQKKIPLNKDHIFRLHSLSKIFVATGIFQLLEEGILSAEDPVSEYVPGLPMEWKRVQVKHLLSHSSGLPDIVGYIDLDEQEARSKVLRDSLRFRPGQRFEYNQTNFWLLNKVVEQVCGENIQDFLEHRQFGAAADSRMMFLSGNSEAVPQQAKGHVPNEKHEIQPDNFQIPSWLFGAAGMNISLKAFLNWNSRLDDNRLLSPGGKKAMWMPFDFSEEFSFAHGWGIYNLNYSQSYGFTGGRRVGFRKFPKENLTIILLTNGYNYSFDVDELINRIAGMARPELEDKKLLVQDVIYENFENKSWKVALDNYSEIRGPENYDFESFFNGYGYELLRKGENKKAIRIFRLNTEENPNSWNVHDSLGEAYEAAGEPDKAVESYQISLSLNPDNLHAAERIERICP